MVLRQSNIEIDDEGKGKESLYNHVIIVIDTTINHIDTRATLLRYKGSCMYTNANGTREKFTIKYMQHISNCKTPIIGTQMVAKLGDSKLTQVQTNVWSNNKY